MPDLNLDPTDELHNIEVAEFEIEHEDVFHMKNLYKLIHDWFQLHEFKSVDDNDPEKFETLYFERILQNGNSEHHIWWRAHFIPKGNKYYKYFLKLDYQTLNMGKHEATVNGKKMKTNKGDVIFRCRAYLMLDYNKEWRNHSILKMFDHFFIKRIYKKQIDFLRTDLWLKTYKLHDVIKQYMELKTSREMPESFHPPLGV
jgi:hypothetical protein